jgi:hypothetical protein
MGDRAAILGLEFDWLAVDSESHVAFFSTAGAGYAPAAFVEDTEAHSRAIDEILTMPVRTKALCERELAPGLVNTWRLVAERGVFAFDSDPLGGPYRLIARPDVPVRLAELPAAVAEVVQGVTLRTVRFDEARELSESQLSREDRDEP